MSLPNIILFLILLSFKGESACNDYSQLEKYINQVLTNKDDKSGEYPKPPKLPSYIEIKLEEELENDSAKFYFTQFRKDLFLSNACHIGLKYFEKKQDVFTLASLSIHWNPNVRVYSQKALNKVLKVRELLCLTKVGYEEINSDNKLIGLYLIYILNSNPIFISGSENSTIHGFFVSNITWNLDLITKENITDHKLIYEWYKNNLQYENAKSVWKNKLIL